MFLRLYPTFKSFLLIDSPLLEFRIRIYISNAKRVFTKLKPPMRVFADNSIISAIVGSAMINFPWLLWMQPISVLTELHLLGLNFYFLFISDTLIQIILHNIIASSKLYNSSPIFLIFKIVKSFLTSSYSLSLTTLFFKLL